MKLWRKLVLPVLAAALVALLVGPLASPAAALVGVSVCVVVGTVDVLPWAVGVLPPGSGATVPNAYAFNSVRIVCVGAGVHGAPVGVFLATSGGGTNLCGLAPPPPLTGTFCGNYNLAANPVGLLACAGTVGGPALPGNAPLGPWSFTFGLLILGNINCPAMGLLVVGNTGVVALVALPDPTTAVVGGPLPLTLGGGLPCGLPPVNLGGNLNLPGTTPLLAGNLLLYVPLVGFCGLIVAGVAVIVAA